MVLSRFRRGELRISPPTTSLPVRCLLPMPVPRLIPIMSSVSCVTRTRPLSSASNVTSSSVILARKCTKSRRCLPTTSTSRLMRPCRVDASSSTPRILHCQKHPQYEVNSYCKTDQTAVCPQCVIESHQGHEFTLLSTLSQGFKDTISTLVNKVRYQIFSHL